MANLSFKDAAAFVMPFGKYKNVSVDKIAETDNGLLYLDWMRGNAYAPHIKDVIGVYLDDPTIAAELKKAMEARS